MPLEKPLARVGFDLVLHVGPEAPLAVVPGDKDHYCVAAASEPSAVLSLRQTGGGEVARGGVLAWCDGEATSRIVRRKGGGTITVASADVARIGGLVGAVEASRAAGLSAPSTWLPRGALGPAVTHALRATGILPTSIFATDAVTPRATVRLVAIARSDGPPSEDGKGLACSPAWPGASALCVLPAGRGWERPPYKAALAVAPLPPWATVLATVTNRRALEDVSALLVLSRRLAREGFEPTILEREGAAARRRRDGARGRGRRRRRRALADAAARRPADRRRELAPRRAESSPSLPAPARRWSARSCR